MHRPEVFGNRNSQAAGIAWQPAHRTGDRISMKYFLTIFALCIVAVMVIAGKRGDMSRRPPIELFPDMDRQPKLRPQTFNKFFADQLSSQLPVEGTIARTKSYELGGKPILVNGQPAFPYEDAPINT